MAKIDDLLGVARELQAYKEEKALLLVDCTSELYRVSFIDPFTGAGESVLFNSEDELMNYLDSISYKTAIIDDIEPNSELKEIKHEYTVKKRKKSISENENIGLTCKEKEFLESQNKKEQQFEKKTTDTFLLVYDDPKKAELFK